MDLLHVSDETKTSCESADFQFPTASSFRDWTGLHPDLLGFSVTKLCQFSDWLRFCGVCPQWRSVGMNGNDHKQSLDLLKSSRNKLPMLLIKTEENNDRRDLYSVSEGITYNLQLPVPCRNRFIGSSHGWLLCEEGGVIILLNPLSKSTILLPILDDSVCLNRKGVTSPEHFMVKGILTADPHVSPHNYAVLFIYDDMHKLVIYKSGDSHWKPIDLPQPEYVFRDVVCYEKNLYGVTLDCKLVQVDIDSGSAKTIIHESNNLPVYIHLVESEGELLLLQRDYDLVEKEADDYFAEGEIIVDDSDGDDSNGSNGCSDDDESDGCSDNNDSDGYSDDDTFKTYYHPKTKEFKIFKLAGEKESEKWVEIDNIGNQALFVGANHSVSIPAIEFPGCRSNAIYFTNQYYILVSSYRCYGPDEDSGFFNLDDKSCHSHHLLDFCEWHLKPPIWFVPNVATSL